jgi:hypothetical protein
LGKSSVTPQKITVAYRPDATGTDRWTGAFYSITGTVETLTMSRTGDVDDPDIATKP